MIEKLSYNIPVFDASVEKFVDVSEFEKRTDIYDVINKVNEIIDVLNKLTDTGIVTKEQIINEVINEKKHNES